MVKTYVDLINHLNPYLMRYFRGNVAIGGSVATYRGLLQNNSSTAGRYKATITETSDIDIFIRTDMESAGVVSIFKDLIPVIHTFDDKPGNPDYYKMPGITAVKTFYAGRNTNVKINVIILNLDHYSPNLLGKLLNVMGHSLAEVVLVPSYSGLKLKATPAFLLDVKNHVVSVRKKLLTDKALKKIEHRARQMDFNIVYKN